MTKTPKVIKNSQNRCLFAIWTITFAMILYCSAANAQAPTIQPSPTPFAFAIDESLAKLKHLIEPSAVEPIGKDGRYLLVADDKVDDKNGLSLLIVEAWRGVIVSRLGVIKNETDPKWEAMAKDGEYYYVIGNNQDFAVEVPTKSKLFRFKLENEDATDPKSFKIDPTSVTEFDIKGFLLSKELNYSTTDGKTVKIEGLAVNTTGDTTILYIGFRFPFNTADKVQVYKTKLPPVKPAQQGTNKAPINLQFDSFLSFFQFDAKRPDKPKDSDKASPVPLRLSSLEYVKESKGFLVVTSTEDNSDNKNDFYGNTLWFVSDDRIGKKPPSKPDPNCPAWSWPACPVMWTDGTVFERKMKAEGLAVLPNPGGKMRLVIVYDNDPPKTGNISKMECLEMTGDLKVGRFKC